MDDQKTGSRVSRRELLKLMGASATVLAAAPILAACAPAAAPATSGGAAGAPAVAATTLEMWTFVNTHARWFREMADRYKEEKNPNFELNVSEIAYSDMHDKLQIALQSGGVGAPDVSDIEQGRFGGFLRGGDPGLVDLVDRLNEGGFTDELVATRQALYSYQGKTYGIEHALTPVVLYYRADIWEEAGIDMAAIETWDDFIAAAQQVSTDDVKAIPFEDHGALLRQRGGDWFDVDGNVALDTDLSIDTMNSILAWRDQYGIADTQTGGVSGGNEWWAAVNEGKWLSRVGADWYAGFFKDNAPDLSGKWKAIAMPAWESGGVRTSCWGGTGNCIVKTSPNIEEAWNFQQYSMLSKEGNVLRYELTNLFPPFIPAMSDPRLQQPDEYFSGQVLGALFAEVGPSVPAQYQSPYRAEMGSKLEPLWQDMWDGKLAPADAFTQVAEEIRKTMAEEQG
ncbi:MAG: extracellular solute-binding protein [Caldilineaceae bacterium]|nr:extracellular solute-binding protein [Caldilineaceae bacterium]